MCEHKVVVSNCLSLSLVGLVASAVIGVYGCIGEIGGDDDVDAFYCSVLKSSIDIFASMKMALQLV